MLVRHAALAEEVGFDMVVVSEHFHPWVDDVSASGFAFSTLGAIATVTESVEIATGVTTPLFRYHPALVAQAAATVDRLSDGRFRLGVGTGENLNEGPLGIPFPRYAERAERMTEALEIMRGLLDGERMTFDGKWYTTDRARLYSPPVSRVPIWMAAGGPKSATLAATLADGVITSVKDPAATQERVVEPAREAAARARRPSPTLVATRWSIFAATEEEAWESLGAWRGLRAPGRLEAVDPRTLRVRADEMPREEILAGYPVAAGPLDYIEIYRPLVTEARADVVVIQTTSLDQEATIRLLGSEVLPELRSLTGSRD
jgi:coenzyme F420-dependent glucose-6-phosphate dehydrogenase